MNSVLFRSAYWKNPFEILCQPKNMVEFFVMEVEEDMNSRTLSFDVSASEDNLSMMSAIRPTDRKYKLADVWVMRSFEVGQSDAQTFHCRTHLGRHLRPGDTVYGKDASGGGGGGAR